MVDDLKGMWNKLSLGKGDDDDDDDDAYVDDQTVNECKSENSLSLVGKLLLRKPCNLTYAMKVALSNTWQLPNEVDIEEVFEHVFIFQFASAIERGKVLFRQPWSFFNKALIVFREFNDIEEIDDLSFNSCLF